MRTKVLRISKGAAFSAAALAGLLVLVLALSLALVGCTQLPSNGFGAAVPVRQALDDSNALIVGDPASSSKSTTITNRIGQSIMAVSLKLSTEAEYGQPFLNQEWTDGQALQIFISGEQPKQLAGQQGEQQAADADQALLFDVKLQMFDGVILEIVDVELYSIRTADLRIDMATGLAYLNYQNALGMDLSTLKQSIDTKAAEDALREAQAREEAEAAKRAAAEAEAANQAPSYSYDYVPSPNSGGATQTDDACVDDIIIR